MHTFAHPIEHPDYCDPRVCTTTTDQHGGQQTDHRSSPLQLRPTRDDLDMTVGLARYDLDSEGHRGDTGSVRLDLLTGWGAAKDVGVDLTAADARLLAAALSCAADQLDALAGPELPKQRGAR